MSSQGFHAGRPEMRGFFEQAALAKAGLEVELIWESATGRGTAASRDVTVRKRWLAGSAAS